MSKPKQSEAWLKVLQRLDSAEAMMTARFARSSKHRMAGAGQRYVSSCMDILSPSHTNLGGRVMKHYGKLGAVLVAALLGASATAALAQSHEQNLPQHKKLSGAQHKKLSGEQNLPQYKKLPGAVFDVLHPPRHGRGD
jgi:hypothetical protein